MMIKADWPASDRVVAFSTTRTGGASRGRFESLNLSLDVGDDPAVVMMNRKIVSSNLPLGTKIKWLQQDHGGRTVVADCPGLEKADASWTSDSGWACAIQTADCLPVLFCDVNSTCIGAAHVGWRGLLCDILENVTKAVPVEAEKLMAWFGPRIGPAAFEIGEEVVQKISSWVVSKGGVPSEFLKDHPRSQHGYLADLSGLATFALSVIGVTKIYGVNHCSYSESDLFFSHRRELGQTGRMATLISLKS